MPSAVSVTRHRRGRVSGASGRGEAPALPDVLQFMRLLWALDHGLQRISKRMLRGLGVTGPQRLAVRLIGKFPDISPGELAALLHIHPSTLTGMLARLLDQQLIVRTADARDARRSRLRLSRSGARIDAVRTGTVETAVQAVLRRTTAGDQQCVARVLGQLSAAFATAADGGPGAEKTSISRSARHSDGRGVRGTRGRTAS